MRRIALCFAVLSALACSDDKKNNDDDQDTDEGTEVGPAGGQVVADDGALTLDIPPGAVAENVRITITSHGPDGGEASFPGIPTVATYEFGPEGLTFALPVTVTAVLPGVAVTTGDNTRVPMVIALTHGSGVADINPRQHLSVDIDAGSTVHTTEISHFSGVGYHMFPSAVELTFEPHPPAVMRFNTSYNVGVRVKNVSDVLAGNFDVIYDDNSDFLNEAALGATVGAAPVNLAHYDGPFLDIDEVVPAGAYACLGIGSANYAATVSTGAGTGITPPGPLLGRTCSAGCAIGSQGDAAALQPSWPFIVPLDYIVEVKRVIDCQPAEQVDPPMGPPYSGLVQYYGVTYPAGDLYPSLNAVFYDGGAEQAKFDSMVNAIQRFYGIVPLRGTTGSCFPVTIHQYDDGEGGMIDTLLDPDYRMISSHIGSGGNDAVVAKFPEVVTASFEPDVIGMFGFYNELVNPSDPPNVLPSGIPVYAPADAASPVITLPGLAGGATSEVSVTPVGGEGFPDAGVTVSWQSDEIDAEFMHVLVLGTGNLGMAAYECWVLPSTQVLTIDQSVIDDLLEQSWNGSASAGHAVSVQVLMAKRREVAYQGRTLIGFFVRNVEEQYYSCGEGC